MSDLATPQPYIDPAVAYAQKALDDAKASAAAKAAAVAATATATALPAVAPSGPTPVSPPASTTTDPVVPAQPNYAAIFTALLGAAGPLTSEFKIAKTSGNSAVIMWVLGAVTTIASIVAGAFSAMPDNKIAIIAGVSLTLIGAIKQTLVTIGYGQQRQAVKESASSAISAIAAAQAAS